MECDLDSFGTDKLSSDLEPEHINALPDTVHRHKVDLEVYFPFHLMLLAETDDQDPLRIIPCPNAHCFSPTVYGTADHWLIKRDILNRQSLIRASLDCGQAGVVGKGPNV